MGLTLVVIRFKKLSQAITFGRSSNLFELLHLPSVSAQVHQVGVALMSSLRTILGKV